MHLVVYHMGDIGQVLYVRICSGKHTAPDADAVCFGACTLCAEIVYHMLIHIQRHIQRANVQETLRHIFVH